MSDTYHKIQFLILYQFSKITFIFSHILSKFKCLFYNVNIIMNVFLYNYRKRYGGKIIKIIMIVIKIRFCFPDDLTKMCGGEYSISPLAVAYDNC